MRAARPPLAALLLAAAVAGSAESSLDVSVSADDLADPLAAISAGLDIGDEHLLGDTGAVRWGLGAGGSFHPVGASVSGSAAARLEASWSSSGRVLVGRLSGSASASSTDGVGPLAAALDGSLVIDGDTAGFSLQAWVAVQGLADACFEAGLGVGIPVLAGSAVFEPALSAGLRWDEEAAPGIRLEPGLTVSWYPAIPVTIEAGFRWTARIAASGGWDSEWAGTLSLSGALGGALLFTATGSLGRGPDGTSGDARAEIAIELGACTGGELSLPIRIAITGSDAEGVAVGAGVGFRFTW